MTHRWGDYFLVDGARYDDFWTSYLADKKDILFILGRGFDPRMCLGIESLLEKNSRGKNDCILIQFDEGKNSPSRDFESAVETNMSKLHTLIPMKNIDKRNVRMQDDEGHRIGSFDAAKIFTNYNDFKKYTDIIVDISSLPLTVYFPLIGTILSILDKSKNMVSVHRPNLHVVVAESIQIDKSIKQMGLSDDASYLHGFTGMLDAISNEMNPSVWIPIMGENQSKQLQLIHDHISSSEICLVLPSPSVHPRRGDEILIEHRELLEADLSLGMKNIIYASEENPFEVYRQIYQTIDHFNDSLSQLGKPKFVISPLSSKLMSMGAFLVAYEEGVCKKETVGIAHVESSGYWMKSDVLNSDPSLSSKLFSLWIFGEPYDD